MAHDPLPTDPSDREDLRRERLRRQAALLAEEQGSTAHLSGAAAGETLTWRDAEAPAERPLPDIPGYRIVRRIARGGMGEVLEARHESLGRSVAIKLPLAEQGVSAAERERFLREARAAARLRHPHICTVYEIGEINGMPYIAMDLVHGQTLKQWRRERQPTARQVAETVALLCRAVGYAHEQGIVHRDIKPSNVMLDEVSGPPMLMDFGLAKQFAEDGVALTCSGQILGTPAYMSPEQAAGRIDEVGPPTDVYALGAVLYEMLCERPPFQGNVGEILARIQTSEPPAPRTLNAKIHRDLETICLKAMAKASPARYSSAIALAEDLERFSAGEPILARRASLTARGWRVVRRNPVASGLTIAVLIALAALGLLFRRTSGALEISRLTQAFEAGLDQPQFSDEHLANMEAFVDQLASLAPDDAAAARKRLYERYASLHHEVLKHQTLEPELEARVLHAADILGNRAPDLVDELKQKLAERRQTWDLVAEVKNDTPPDEVFEAGTAMRSGTRLIPVIADGDAARPASVLTLAHSRGAVEIDATFDAGWEEATQIGVLLNATPGHTAQVVSLGFSADGTRLITGSLDGTAKVCDYRTSTVVATLRGIVGGVRDVALSADGRLLATASFDLKLWDLAKFVELANPCPGRGAVRVAFSPNQNILALAEPSGALTTVDLTTNAATTALAGHDNPVLLALSGDGRWLALAFENGAIETWDVATGKRLGSLTGDSPAIYLALSRDGRRGAVVRKGQANTVQLFDGRTGQAEHPIVLKSDVSAITFSAQANWLAVADWGGGVRIWDTARGELKAVLSADGNFQAQLQSLAFSPDDSLLAGGTAQAIVKIWDTQVSAERYTLADSNYTFRLTAPDRRASDAVAGTPGAPLTLRQVRRSAGGLSLEILRDGVRLTDSYIPAQQLSTGDLRIVASRQDDRLTIRLNDLPPLEYYDTFPLPRTRSGAFGLLWPRPAALKGLKARRKAAPALASEMERGDDALASGELHQAIDAYREVSVSSAGTTLGEEALFKLATCLASSGQTDEAHEILGRLAASEGDRWPMLAACHIWLEDVRAKRFNEAQQVFDTLSARYGTEKFAQIIPSDLREQILAAYRMHSRDFYLYAPDANRVLNLERAIDVERALGGAVDRYANGRWYLLRAYHAAGRIDDALALAKEVIGDAQPGNLGFGLTWAGEYAWLLAVSGRREEALAFLDRLLVEGEARSYSYWLLLSRAQIYAAEGRWQEAERDIEELVQFEPVEQMPEASRPLPSLVRGLLRQHRGDAEGALAAWRQGRLVHRDRSVGGSARLSDLILASLIGELSDAESEQIGAELFAEFTDNTPLGATKNIFRLPATAIREAWRSPRGRAAAQQIAFREVAMPELIRLPALVLGLEMTRQVCFGGSLSDEEESVVWDLADRSYTAYSTGRIKTAQVVQAVMTLKGNNNFLGWQGLKPSLSPDLRAPMAYIFGARYLRTGRAVDARQLFETVKADAPEDTVLSRLAGERLQAMNNAQ